MTLDQIIANPPEGCEILAQLIRETQAQKQQANGQIATLRHNVKEMREDLKGAEKQRDELTVRERTLIDVLKATLDRRNRG